MSSSLNAVPGLSSLASSEPGSPLPGRLTGIVSAALHALALAAVVVVPILGDEPLPERATRVQAFFASPIELAPPPPPPPPPPAPRGPSRPEPPRTTPAAAGFVAPVEVPLEIVPESGLDLGIEGGVPGGVEGGVPGGVVGGVVGGLPEAPPPPPRAPVRVGLHVREPRKVRDVPPVYPSLAVASRVEGVVVVECVVDPRGRVVEATVLRGVPLLDDAALEAVRQWVYTPTLIDGEPVPILMTVTVNFRLRSGR
jgi:periplasmic protein TonB